MFIGVLDEERLTCLEGVDNDDVGVCDSEGVAAFSGNDLRELGETGILDRWESCVLDDVDDAPFCFGSDEETFEGRGLVVFLRLNVPRIDDASVLSVVSDFVDTERILGVRLSVG